MSLLPEFSIVSDPSHAPSQQVYNDLSTVTVKIYKVL